MGKALEYIAADKLKKYVHNYVRDKYIGQTVEVSGQIETNPEIMSNRSVMVLSFQVKKIVENTRSAVMIDRSNLDYSESFSMSMFDSGVIIDG